MTLARDTTPAARRMQVLAFQRLDGRTRLRMALQMSDDSRGVTLSGIRHRHPDWSELATHAELLRLMLGTELSTAVLGRLRVRR
jgi:hypothetical protein